jgi:HEAT repeat protein
MSVERLQELIRASDPEIRRQSVARAAQHAGDEGVDLLLQGLGDEDWRVRKEAVQALLVRNPQPYAIQRLVATLHPGDNVGLRNAAVEALAGLGSLAIDALSREVHELDADGRKLAAEALARTNHVAALGPLSELCRDADPNVKAAATEAIAEVGRVAPEVALPILEEALSETDSFQLLVALDAIRRLGLAPSWFRLEPVLREAVLRPVGLQLAARLGEPLAAPYFVQQLNHARGQTWLESVTSFGEFIECSRATFEGARSAAQRLTEDVVERLLTLCNNPQEQLHCGGCLSRFGIARRTRVARTRAAPERWSSAGTRGVRRIACPFDR